MASAYPQHDPYANGNQAMTGHSAMYDVESQQSKAIAHASDEVRQGFVAKVFGILSAQLILTGAIVLVFVVNEDIAAIGRSAAFLYTCLAFTFGIICALSCVPALARTPPMNYVLLFAFTVFEACLLGAISSTYTTASVVLALGLTTAVTLAMTAIAVFTKIDFTQLGGVLCSALCLLILVGIFAIFFPVLSVVYAALGAIVFSVFIIYDVQLIIGGRHKKYQFDVDDYVFAALSLYLDIVNLFLFLLSLFGSRD